MSIPARVKIFTISSENKMPSAFHRKHMTLGTTPAMKARIADHIWSIEEIIGLLERREQERRAA